MAVFRVEKTRDYTVMANHHLKNRNLSLKAKGLLSVILSLPDEWDYTLKGLARISKEGVDAIREAIRELESEGYVVRSRSRNERGQLGGAEYVIYEHPQPVSDNPTQAGNKAANPLQDTPLHDKPVSSPPILEPPVLESPMLDFPTQENPTQLNTKVIKTYPESKKESTTSIYPSIHPSYPSDQTERRDGLDLVKEYRSRIHRNIEYYEMSETYHSRIQQLDEIIDIMVETLCSQRPTISVAGDELPASLVKERLLKLNSTHIEYVMDSLKANTTPVRNIKRYLLTVLFNAPATIDNYYKAQFQHQYYGGGNAERSRA